MKTLFSQISILLVFSALVSTNVFGQVVEKPNRESHKIELQNTQTNTPILVEQYQKTLSGAELSAKFKKPVKKSPKDDIDTLNYPLVETYSIYSADAGGYVTGNNSFDDLAKANKFVIPQACQLTGILFDFYLATGGPTDIEIVVWDNSGPINAPGEIIGSSTVSMSSVQTDINNNQLTYIEFDEPIIITTTFYAGIILPTSAGDTLVVWSNTDGDIVPGTAWEQWTDNSWIPMFSNDTWGKNLIMAIFPIVEYNDLPLMADFMGSSTNIQPGGSVIFTDLSTGNPTSRLWTFEGGDPANSTDASVMVSYENIGTYDVTLMVEKDTEQDTKMVSDYITVEESSIEVDTLNFPLAGEYAIYITEENAYVTGNNEFGDLAKANYCNINETTYITGVLYEFAYGTGNPASIEFAIWNNSGTDNSPGSKIAFKTLPFDGIIDDIISESFTYVEFNPPVLVNSPFYAGFVLPTTTNDTLVVWSNTNGESGPDVSWELWSSEDWYSISEAWTLDISLAIYPIVQNTMDINENSISNGLKIYPNPSNGKYAIELLDQTSRDLQLEVYNTSGVCIKNQFYKKGEFSISFNLTDCPAGIYMVRLFDGHKYFTRKILKQ